MSNAKQDYGKQQHNTLFKQFLLIVQIIIIRFFVSRLVSLCCWKMWNEETKRAQSSQQT